MLVLGWPFTPLQGLSYARRRKFTVGTSQGYRDGIWGQCAEDIEKWSGMSCHRCWVNGQVTKVIGICFIRRARNADSVVDKYRDRLQPDVLELIRESIFAERGPQWYRYDDGLSKPGHEFFADDDEEDDFVIPEPPIFYESPKPDGEDKVNSLATMNIDKTQDLRSAIGTG